MRFASLGSGNSPEPERPQSPSVRLFRSMPNGSRSMIAPISARPTKTRWVGAFSFGRLSSGTIRTPGVPTRWSGSPPHYRHHAPRFGEHSEPLLREAGFSQAEIEQMAREGVTVLGERDDDEA